jgi:hypothetical protein
MTFRLDDVVLWGRSFDEYCAMFALSESDLAGRLLGCGDGPASFNAVASRRGHSVISADPVFRFSAQEIEQRITETVPTIAAELRANADEFVWTHFSSPAALIEKRLDAMSEFLRDYPRGLEDARYIDASLPRLPFGDREFDLALCSHFLFLYSEHYDAEFHVESIGELCRVSREARIFPLLELGSIESRHLGTVMDRLGRRGLLAERVHVDYEFQCGGNEMLRVKMK